MCSLINFPHFHTDGRTHPISDGRSTKTSGTPDSPQTKRQKQGEQDLTFLQVKNKDGQDCLFVDLGKKKQRILLFSLMFDTAIIFSKHI